MTLSDILVAAIIIERTHIHLIYAKDATFTDILLQVYKSHQFLLRKIQHSQNVVTSNSNTLIMILLQAIQQLAAMFMRTKKKITTGGDWLPSWSADGSEVQVVVLGNEATVVADAG